jgi:hypothetical protein
MQNDLMERIYKGPIHARIKVSEEDQCVLELFSNEMSLPLLFGPMWKT